MLITVKCPKDKQRLFDLNTNGEKPIRLDALSRYIKAIEVKCPKCGGIVSIDLTSEELKVTMKSLGNIGQKRERKLKEIAYRATEL